MKHALIAAIALLSFAACAALAPSSSNPSQTLPLTRADAELSTNLYVADRGLNAVAAFDSHGNKLAEKTVTLPPIDVVTDSHGNVYVLSFEARSYHYFSGLEELSHDLSKVIAVYNTFGTAQTMTIDASDNLYVEESDPRTGYTYVARYPYGSTKSSKAYSLGGQLLGKMAGISARGSTLYMSINPTNYQSSELYECPLAGYKCVYRSGHTAAYGCGFTTTHLYSVFNFANKSVAKFHPLTAWRVRDSRIIDLPLGYYFGSNPGCNFHNYGEFVWGGMQTGGSQPAVAVELDMVHNDVHATVGAGYLEKPVAAYYGNGFKP